MAQLIALAMLGAMFVPAVRQMLFGLGAFLVGAVVLALVIAVGVQVRCRFTMPLPSDQHRAKFTAVR